MIPQPAKQQPNVEGEHPRESACARVAAHGGRAHTCRGRRGSSHERPRQLRLAQRLVGVARALHCLSGYEEQAAEQRSGCGLWPLPHLWES